MPLAASPSTPASPKAVASAFAFVYGSILPMPVPPQTRMLARIIFGLALLGILVVTHLGLQVEKGFSDGCTGFGDVAITAGALDAAPEVGGCGAVAAGEYADFLGVSNIVWGLLFYIGLALLRLAYASSGNSMFRLASFGMASVGILYTLYLIYLQAVVIGEYCILCMTSAVLVTILFVLHVLEHRKLAGASTEAAPRTTARAALMPYGVLAGIFAVLLAADVVLAGGDPAEPSAFVDGTGDETPETAPPTSLAPPLPQGCAYDPVFAPVTDFTEFVNNPAQGTGPVTVVEVFDPNCPACRALHETLRAVKTANADRATFYSVPFPLRQPTVGQAASLAWARETGSYFDLTDEFFSRQDGTWGMDADELRESANAVGLDGPSLIATLENQAQLQPLLDQVQADANAVQSQLAAPGGNISTPKLVINGRVVANTNQSLTEDCLNQFIAEASALQDAPPAVVEEVQ